MSNLQKTGGFAALYLAAAYIIGFLGFFLLVDMSGIADPVQRVAFIADNQSLLSALYLIVYIIWGLVLIVLSLALYDRLKRGAPALAQVAAALGVVWGGLVIASGMIYNTGMETVVSLFAADPAQAGTVWLTIESIHTAIGGGNEIVGGVWIILVSWAALRSGAFGRLLNYLGVVIGLAGIASAVPALGEVGGMVFGLGQIVWFLWLGVALLRGSSRAVPQETATLATNA